jgi:hypothetical protein
MRKKLFDPRGILTQLRVSLKKPIEVETVPPSVYAQPFASNIAVSSLFRL